MADLLGLEGAQDRIGESWEFSTLDGSTSRALGKPLAEVLGRPLSFLAKLIDTSAPLSVQVHPRDGLIAGALGKEEAWVILEAADGAHIYAGLREGVTADMFRVCVDEAIDDVERGDRVLAALTQVPVRPGMVVLVPAGTVHAIGPGILLAEIQQPTDCTFRFYDYGSKRPIHPARAFEALEALSRPQVWTPTEGPKSIVGEHLELAPLLAGGHDVTANGGDVLLIPVHDGVTVRVDGDEHTLTRGALRLLAEGGHMRVTVPERGVAILGALP